MGKDGEAVADNAKRFVDGGMEPSTKLHVDGGAGDLDYVSDIFCHKYKVSVVGRWSLSFLFVVRS